MHLVPGLFRILEIDAVDLHEGKIPFAFLRAANLALDRVTGSQRKLPDLARADVDVVGAGQVVGVG